MKADGYVIIDSELKTDGVEAGSKEIEAAARRMASSVSGLSQKAQVALQKQVDSFSKLNDQYAQQARKVEELKRKIDEYSNQKIPTEEYAEIQKQINNAKARLDSLIQRQEKFIELGGSKKSTSYKSMQYDIDELTKTIRYATGELRELEATGQAFTLGASTKAAKEDMEQLQRETTKLKDMNNRLASSYATLKAKVNDYNDSLGETEKKSKKARMGVGRMLATSLMFSFVFSAINTVMDGFKTGMNNLAQYSNETNSTLSGLLSALTRLKNALATAFAPLLTVVAPALHYVINLITTLSTAIAHLIAVFTGKNTFVKATKVQQDYAESLKETGSAAKGAGEDAKGSLASFDKLNVQAEQNTGSTGGGSASSISPNEMFETVSVSNKLVEAVERMKSKLSEVKDFVKQNAGDIVAIVGGMLAGIGTYLAVSNWSKIVSGIITAFNVLKNGIVAAVGGISPVALGIAAVVGIVVAAIIDLWNTSESFRNTVTRAWELISSAVTEAWSAIWNLGLKPLGEALIELAKAIYDFYETSGLKKLLEIVISGIISVAGYLFSVLVTAVGGTVTIITGAITILIKLITDIINTATWLLENWKAIWSAIKDFASNMIETISTKISTTMGNIKDNIATALKNVKGTWIETWSNVKTKTVEIFSGIWSNIKGKINSIIGGVEKMANSVIKAINGMIDGVNGIADFIPGIGSNFIPRIPDIHLPRLASGTVVPPRAGEFAAILGDNRRETEVVSPLSTMKQALKEALMESGLNDSGGMISLVVNLDGKEIYRTVVDRNRAEKRRTGKNPLLE